MGIKFDHSQYALDADMALGAANNTITKAGPFTDEEFFRSLLNPGFDGSLRYLMASCAAALSANNTSSAEKLPATGADDASIGTVAWTNPTYIYADDAQYATAVFAAAGQSHYLKATNFSFNLPATAVVTNIEVKVKSKTSLANYGTFSSVRLVKGGAITGAEKTYGVMSVTEGTYSFSGSPDSWGLSLLYSDVNAATFGVVVSVSNAYGGAVTVSVNDIEILVSYYIPTTVTYKWQGREIGQAWTDLLSGSVSLAPTVSIADDIIKDAVATTFDAVPIDFRLIMTCADAYNISAQIASTGIKTRMIGEST